jgi:hypothetical protein
MEQHFLIKGHSIKVTFEKGIAHIYNNEELWNLLNEATEAATEELVNSIKQSYKELYGTEFNISNESLCVEIWGHVYFEYFAIVFEKLVSLNLIKQITHKISSYCEVIDSGESNTDNNRFFWDMLAPFKNQIASLLPQEINTSKFKRD